MDGVSNSTSGAPIACRSVTAGYQSCPILHDVSFVLPRGSIGAALGPNGAGKTTLLRVLTGQLRPSSGTALLDNSPVADIAPSARAKRLGFVPQSVVVSAPYRVRELVLLGRTPHRSPFSGWSRADNDAADAAINDMDLGAYVNTAYSRLSAGEQQRVLLAIALAQEAPILLLDEPTAHLDIRHAWSLMRRVVDLATSKGHTVFFTTHDLHLAQAYASTILLLKQGRLVAQGSPSDVMTSATLTDVFGHPVAVESLQGRTWIQPQA